MGNPSRFGKATPLILQPLALATSEAAPTSKKSEENPPEFGSPSGFQEPGLSALLERAKGARSRKESLNAPVESVTCVFSVETKRRIQEAAGAEGVSVARWIGEAFRWSFEHISATDLSNLAVLVAEERNARNPDGTSCRASGTGVPIRGDLYPKVVSYAKNIRPKISHAALLEAAAVARLHQGA